MLKCLNAKMLKWHGFTLIELLVSIFIIVFMSGIIFANYRVSGQQFALQRSANKLAQDIRRAQAMAMGAAECPECGGGVPPGYGVILDKNWDNKKYRLYADTNGDNGFFTPPDAIIEPPYVELEKGVIIKEISLPPDTYSSVSINFKPPDPTVSIKFNVGPSGQPETIITLALETDLNKTKIVKVNSAGLIEIQ
jgi:prepilin-type N-terminal cleavage/methylation domain-containing protein